MSVRPNILFLMSDQHNAKVLGHEGHPQVKTPHLDRLAGAGVRLTNAIVQNPICTPSRLSFLSGQYCHNHGYYGLDGISPGGLPSVFGHFRRAGYFTSAVGKIHCPEYWVEDDCDHFHDTSGTSVLGRSPDYTRFLEEHGKDALEEHHRMPEFGKKGVQSMDSRVSPLTFAESQEGWAAAKTIEGIQLAQAAGQPFFAFSSYARPHQCTAPSEPFWSMYEGVELTLPPNADYDLRAAGKAPNLIKTADQWRTGAWALLEPKTFAAARMRKLRGYLGAVSQVDAAVGKILDYLDAAGLAENTIVIYTSDHGDYACEHGIMEKAPGICADAITRVPMIWRWPGRFQEGRATPQLVEAVDVVNTLCDLAEVEPMETSDGTSAAALLQGQEQPIHDYAVTEFPWSKSIRKGNYRLVWYPQAMFPAEYPQGFGELYDVQADPWEMKNLYFEAQYQGLVTEMTRDLMNWLVTTTRVRTLWPPYTKPRQTVARYKSRVNGDGKMPWRYLRESAGGTHM